MFRAITRTVWILSLISLFTDSASEMLYPIMPIYLKTIGFSIWLIGILEGFAEGVAGLSKGYFGKLSDISGKRTPFVQLGYSLSAISKPLMALFIQPVWIFLARALDRVGKGVRTGARDALLSDESSPQTKGKIFGFHRSMDTLGAVFGPLIALTFLHFHPHQYKSLFLIAFIPGTFAILTSSILKEKKKPHASHKKTNAFLDSFRYWKESPQGYRKLLIGLLLFTLFNSSDAFLILKGKQAGLSDEIVIWIYIFYNLVYALMAFPIGILGDKVGLKKILLIGLFIFAVVYAGMAFQRSISQYLLLFFLYGIYAAATEGISKAWISNIVNRSDTATAIGLFAGLQSVCTLVASSLTGLLWFQFGPLWALLTTAVATIIIIVYFLSVPKPT